MTTVTQRWRKSSKSAEETDCVEVHGRLDAVRDSKNPATGVLAGVAVAELVAAVRTGRLD